MPTSASVVESEETSISAANLLDFCSGLVQASLVSIAGTGAASENLAQLTSVEMPENITFVIQTGGAKDWSNQQIDSNKTQRFTYTSDGFKEVDSLDMQDMGKGETLAGFLDYCQTNYQADHRMLLFWDHGGGCFGAEQDSATTNIMTLADMQQALSSTYGEAPESAPFEAIGYDCCMMANLEVAQALAPYGNYLIGSEESEPGSGWDWTAFAKTLASHPEYNGAKLGRELSDAYIENNKQLGCLNASTFSVIDLKAVPDLYASYSDFALAALKLAKDDSSVLGRLGTAALEGTRFADTSADIYNLVDLGNFMQNSEELLPQESAAVLEDLDEAVLYSRQAGVCSEATGLSVYFPGIVKESYSLDHYINYVNDICQDAAISALYHYKIAGCISEEESQALAQEGLSGLEPLDTSCMQQVSSLDLSFSENSMTLDYGDEVHGLTQEISVVVSKTLDDGARVKVDRLLGQDNYFDITGDGSEVTDTFTGTWIQIDGHPLCTSVISTGDGYIRYSAPVSYNDSDCELIFDFYSDGSYEIEGVRPYTGNSYVLSRELAQLQEGDKLACAYWAGESGTSLRKYYDDSFIVSADTAIEDAQMRDGTYNLCFSFTDVRGSTYLSKQAEMVIEGDTITCGPAQHEVDMS